jgi:hypothetical protein
MHAAVATGNDHRAGALTFVGQASVPCFILGMGGGFPTVIALGQVLRQGAGEIHGIIPIFSSIPNSPNLQRFREIKHGRINLLDTMGRYKISMTHQSPLAAPLPLPSASIRVLRCADRFHMNPIPVQQLFAQMPAHEAEDIICRALEDIAGRLDGLHHARMAGVFSDIATPSRRIAAVARQIGLTTISDVAEHVACAADLQNNVALGATLARLERAFDMAVSHVWDNHAHEQK